MKKQFFLLVVAVAAMFAACSKDNETTTSNEPLVPPVPEQNLVAITDVERYDPKELPELISHSALAHHYFGDESMLTIFNGAIDIMLKNRLFILDTTFAHRKTLIGYERDWQIEAYDFTYQSRSAAGEPIVLSGRVTFPAPINGTGHTLRSLSLCTHFLLHSLPQAPTVDDPSPFAMRALYNSAVIEPDYEGYGATDNKTFPGFSFEVQGMQMADCIRAAMQVMKSRGIRMADNFYSTAWGNSLATPGVMGFLKVYDTKLTQEQRDQIRLKSSYVGSGPLLLHDMVRYFDEHPEYDASGLVYLPGFLGAMPKSYLGGYELKDFFPSWMQTHMLVIDGEVMSFFEASLRNKMVWYQYPDGVNVSNVAGNLAEDMCTADGHLDYNNPKTKILMDIIERMSDWSNWTPQQDIYHVHCRQDNYIPYEQAEKFANMMSFNGKLHFKELHYNIPEGVLSAHGGSTAFILFLSFLHEDPADSYKFTP